MTLLFDISGAFNNLPWSRILYNLNEKGCKRNIFNILRSYFSNRVAEIQGNFRSVRMSVNKGCPQGSMLGPDMWNLVFDGLLRDLMHKLDEDDKPVKDGLAAYADDLIVVIAANSRKGLEDKSNNVGRFISQ